jgi:hypothetical protein
MLKLISGALIGGVNYKEIYMDSDVDDKSNPPITTNNMGENQNTKIHNIPTLPETARKMARLEKRKLDEKQCIAYEVIACTLLLAWFTMETIQTQPCIHAWDIPWEVLPL